MAFAAVSFLLPTYVLNSLTETRPIFRSKLASSSAYES